MDQEIQDTRILPPILIPHKLLTPNNFKYHMQNVDHIITQSKEFESRQITQQNFLQQTPKNTFDFQEKRSNEQMQNRSSTRQVLKSLNFQKSQPNLKQSYKNLLFNARNFGITQSHYFNPEQTSLHMQQRYGNSRIKKLKPIKKKEDQFFEDNLLYRPKRLSEFDKQYLEKKHFQKIIKLEEFSIIVTFKGFCIELNGGEESEKARKNRVFENLDFQDTHYLGQYSFEYINTFFTRCVSYNEARRKIVLDWESFQKIPYIKSSEQQNQIFPSNLYQDVPNTNMSLELAFPQLNFYINDISHSQKYTCSQEDIKKLIETQFKNLDELLKENFDLQEARNDKDKQNNQYLIKEKQRTENFDRRKSLLTQLKEQQLENQQEQNENENNDNIADQEQQKISEEEKQRKEMEEQFNPEDKELLNTVTKMQANFKGKVFRKQMKKDKISQEQLNKESKVLNKNQNQDLKIDLNDKELVDSVTKIQATFKGQKTRKQVQQIKNNKQQKQDFENQFKVEDQDLVNSVTKIQAGFRGKKVRNEVKDIKKNNKVEEFKKQFNPDDKELIDSVTKIQASFKGKKTRHQVKQLKQEKQNNQQEIQEEREELQFQQQFNPQDKELQNSVTKIQASFKGKKARQEVENLKKEKQQKEFQSQFNPEDQNLQQQAAKIQASFKGKQARQQVKQIKSQKQKEQFEQQFNPEDKDVINSVTKIQASFKGKQVRKQVQQIKNQTKIQENDQPSQNIYNQNSNGNNNNQNFNEQFDVNDKELINSVTKIQASFKGKQTRNQVKQIKKDQELEQFKQQINPEDKDLVNSVTKIQASFKGKKVRNEIQNIKKEKQQEEFKKQFDTQDKELINSITKIQAGFKGKQARNQAKQLKQQSQQNQNQGENIKTENSLTSSKKHNNLNIKNID